MSKPYFTVSGFLQVIMFLIPALFIAPAGAADHENIVITSQTLTADNINNTVLFEGSATAKNDDITISSDKMAVAYERSKGRIIEIRAAGNVRVHKKGRAIFAREATYFGNEEKIVFTGDPKAVEGENVITGDSIIYFLKDDRAVVKGSRVILKDIKDR